jgi:hypothetical protein
VESGRETAPMAKSIVNTKSPTVPRMTLSRNSVVAMIRGLSCPLATWIATSIDPKVKTRNESVSVMMVCIAAVVPASVNGQMGTQFKRLSIAIAIRNAICSSSIAMNGTTHSEDRT